MINNVLNISTGQMINIVQGILFISGAWMGSSRISLDILDWRMKYLKIWLIFAAWSASQLVLDVEIKIKKQVICWNKKQVEIVRKNSTIQQMRSPLLNIFSNFLCIKYKYGFFKFSKLPKLFSVM